MADTQFRPASETVEPEHESAKTEPVQHENRVDPQGEGNVALWVRVSKWACFTILAWSILLQLIAGEIIPPVLAIGLVFGAIGPFLKGERRRLAGVTGLLGLVALGGNLPATIDELSHPSSAPAFILTLMVVVAALVLVVAGIAALRKADGDGVRPLVITSAAVFVAGVVVAIVAAAGVESASALATDVKVTASGVEFEPTTLEVAAGESGFWVENLDGIRHTFSIHGTDYEIDVPGLSAQRGTFDLAAGQYEVFCAVPGHENMKIDLTVEE